MKKNTYNIMHLIILFIAIIFYSCKKETENPVLINTPVNSITSTPAYGYLGIVKSQVYLLNSFYSSDTLLYSKFFSSSVFNTDTLENLYSGTVNYNNDSLSANIYSYTKDININSSILNCNWSVNGNSITPAFSHSYTASYPTFTGNNFLPDSFSINNILSLNLSLASNYTNVRVIFEDGTTLIDKSFSGGNPTFTSSELSILNGATTCNLHLLFSNSHDILVSSKNYRFSNVIENIKTGIKIKL